MWDWGLMTLQREEAAQWPVSCPGPSWPIWWHLCGWRGRREPCGGYLDRGDLSEVPADVAALCILQVKLNNKWHRVKALRLSRWFGLNCLRCKNVHGPDMHAVINLQTAIFSVFLRRTFLLGSCTVMNLNITRLCSSVDLERTFKKFQLSVFCHTQILVTIRSCNHCFPPMSVLS